MWPFSRKSPEEKFWGWFVKNERKLFEQDLRGDMGNTLSDELRRYHDGLVWETSVRPDDHGKRQFAISADGLAEHFSAVEALADAAPPLRLWKVVRFRPREPKYRDFVIKMHGVRIGADSLEVSISPHDGKVDVAFHIRGCNEPHEKNFVSPAFVMLDNALGEYDAVCKVGRFDVVPFDFDAGSQRVTWAEFRSAFDTCFEQMHPG